MIIFYALVFLIALVAGRIPESQRKFTDQCVENKILSLKDQMSPELYAIFQQSFPNTLDTTVFHHDPEEPLTYIITGDIPAMWLRDSTNQVIPYLRIKQECSKIKVLVQGLLNMQAKFIMIDPYTNAFVDYYKEQNRPFYLSDNAFRRFFGIRVDLQNKTQFLTPKIWQRKYEIDSLASFLRLAYQYYTKYGQYDFVNINFVKALKRVMQAIEQTLQDDAYQVSNGGKYYEFFRSWTQLPNGTIKNASRTGLIRTGFRPSDDPNELPYNIPGNAMISTFLDKVSTILLNMPNPFYNKLLKQTALKMKKIGQSIKKAIYQFGVLRTKQQKAIFSYQIDGKGDFRFYDDANLPSLLSLPYLYFIQKSDPLYEETRKSLFSNMNKYYYNNKNVSYLKGIGSSHTSVNQVWPLAVVTQALTSNSQAQILQCLSFLKQTSINNFVHEAVNVNNPQDYTRAWFAWANGFFGELILDISERLPHLLKK